MTEKEFYDEIGGNYEEAQTRLLRDSLIRKFVLKFPGDQNFAGLKAAVTADRWDDAFTYAHTLKGVCMNLAFSRLSAAMVTLTDALRTQNRDQLVPATVREYFAEVDKEYAVVIAAIAKLN